MFRRDITRLTQELRALPDDVLWKTVPGVSNCAGNLALHLEGNLREYIGRQLGGVAYTRRRPEEFSATGVPVAELVRRFEELRSLIPDVLARVSAEQLALDYGDPTMGKNMSTRQVVMSLLAHFSYHLGQIDYLRRVLTGNSALDLAPLE